MMPGRGERLAANRVAGIVLAGGRSRRMGRDKAALVLAGRPLLARAVDAVREVADEVLVVTAPGRLLPALDDPEGVRVFYDASEGEGPLAGLMTGLAAARAPLAVIVGCDMPFVRPRLLRLLLARAEAVPAAPAVVPLHEGRLQPLCAVVRSSLLPRLRALFEAGVRDASAVAREPGALLLEPAVWREADAAAHSFFSVDMPADLDHAEAILATLGDEGA